MMLDKRETEHVQLAILINSYNRVALLREAMGSLETHLDLNELHPAVLIFDAGSQDGSRELGLQSVSRESAALETVLIDGQSLKDRSFSAGVNYLARTAIARYQNLQYLFLFETDNCLKGPDIVRNALRLLDASPDMAAVGFTTVRNNGGPAGFGCRFPRGIELVLGQQITSALRLGRLSLPGEPVSNEEVIYSDIVYTSPLLVKVCAWKAVGGMDSGNFPFSDSDLDLCWRWCKAGWRVGVIRTDRIVHDNQGMSSEWSEKRTAQFHEARLKLLEIHRGLNFWRLYPLLLIRHTAELLCLTIMSPFISSPSKRLKVRLGLILRLHRRYK